MIINYKIKVIPVLVTLVLAFGCKDDNIVNNKTDLDLFTSSVVIIDSNQFITTQNSKISGKIARTVELHNFNSSLILEPTYKIDDVEYCDNGLYNDEIAGDCIYTSIETYSEVSHKLSDSVKYKVGYSDHFIYLNELREVISEDLLDDISNRSQIISYSCKVVIKDCPKTRWYNSCYFSDECSCVYLEDCHWTVGFGF